MSTEHACWRCANPLGELPRPVPRAETCRSCGADLHVCRMCRFHDPTNSRGCRELVADDVRDRERSSFSGYFELSPNAGDGSRKAEARAARYAGRALRSQRVNPARRGKLGT